MIVGRQRCCSFAIEGQTKSLLGIREDCCKPRYPTEIVGKVYRRRIGFFTTPLLVEVFFGEPTQIITLLTYLNRYILVLNAKNLSCVCKACLNTQYTSFTEIVLLGQEKLKTVQNLDVSILDSILVFKITFCLERIVPKHLSLAVGMPF